jgi:hypothetical protein
VSISSQTASAFSVVELTRYLHRLYSSTTGVVNVYDANEITSSVKTSIDASEGLFAGASPRPIRELMNLTTEITNIAFNHDAQMMAVSSSKKKDAFRMVSTERRRSTNGEFTLTINLRLGSVVPPAIRYGVYQLADILHPTWGCHMFRLFGGERVRGDGEYSRKDSVVQRRALQAARRIGCDLYVDRSRQGFNALCDQDLLRSGFIPAIASHSA